MQEVIIDFFQRFRSDITQSRYNSKGIEDYQKLKTFYDYLDYDRNSIFRNKSNNEPCGLRNIGNTCYLNVFLQVLYHLNFLREKIFSFEGGNSNKSEILQELKLLFGRMQLGKLAYADPSNLFQKLKKKYPQVFIDGVQNDFHQICTLLLDELKQNLKSVSQNDSKIIDKMLFGKLTIRTFHSQGKSLRNTRFNIINLDSSYGSLQKALDYWKKYDIEDYLTQNKKIVKASVETQFIQTPALLTFFINRVTYKNNSLVKDNREFKFDHDLFLQKSTNSSSNSTPNSTPKTNKIPTQLSKKQSRKQEQLLENKQNLSTWIQTIQKKKLFIQQSIKYIDQKQFTNIGVPQIQNKHQDQAHIVRSYLMDQIAQIQQKIQQAKKQIISIQDKITRLYEENQTQIYHLWGMMIHEGTNPNSGHYKVVLNNDGNKWIQFNDRKVETISMEKIESYSKKGQICCLFYRRPTLVCNDKKVAIPGALKTVISEIQKYTMEQIDKARLLQNLYQLGQSSGILLEHQIKLKNQNKWSYFFKPILHCLQEQYNFTQCQGVLTYENLKEPTNVMNMENNFLVEKQLKIPQLLLQIPAEYFKYAKIFKVFLDKEKFIDNIDEAYEYLVDNLTIPYKNKTVGKWIEKYLEIFIMKGVFFLCVLYRISLTPMVQAKFTRLYKSVENLLKKLNITSEFTLTYIPIKDEIYNLFQKKIKGSVGVTSETTTKVLKPTPNAFISKMMYENQCQLFKKQFGYWIEKREKLSEIDEEIIYSESKMHMEYIIQIY